METIKGKVIYGDGYGKALGFPTANLDRRSFSRQRTKVKLGIYGGSAVINPQSAIRNPQLLNAIPYKAAIVIGPIDESGLPKIEAHLIGFKGNLYGKKLTISLGKYIRAFKKFKSAAELKNQIKKDVKKISNDSK